MYTFQASIQDGTCRSRIEWLLTGFCCAITTSSLGVGSLERRRVNEGEGLTPYRAGYRDSGNNTSMYSPLMMHCFILSGRGGCCTAGVAKVGAGCGSSGTGGIGMEISQSASGSVMAPDGRFHSVAHGGLRAKYCWVEAQEHAAGVLVSAPSEPAAVLIKVPA